MIVKAKTIGQPVPTPRPLDAALVDPLASRLRQIALLKGEADLSAILPEYDKWYRDTFERFKAHPNADLASAFWSRHRVHVLKLAVVYETSMSGTLRVSGPAWQRAVAMAKSLEETLIGMLGTDMTNVGFKLKQMEERILQAGKSGLRKHEFTKAFKNDIYREKELKTLLDSETVFSCLLPPTGGRPGVVIVHQNFKEEFRADYAAKYGGQPKIA